MGLVGVEVKAVITVVMVDDGMDRARGGEGVCVGLNVVVAAVMVVGVM